MLSDSTSFGVDTDTIQAPYTQPSLFPAEHYPSKKITPLADASASGDLDNIKQILGSYHANRSPGNYELQEIWLALLTAIAYEHPGITSYLLDVGIPLSRLHVQRPCYQVCR